MLGTVFDELNSIKDEDIAKTLEVQFYEEVSIWLCTPYMYLFNESLVIFYIYM